MRLLPLSVRAKRIKQYQTGNIICTLPGQSDSSMAFSAHYDHLGMMGEQAIFCGGNDNASGISTVLGIMQRYASTTKPHYTTRFIFFTGEEAGLRGSTYFVEHPTFPLSSMKLLVNLDLLGTGEEGIMVENARGACRVWRLPADE